MLVNFNRLEFFISFFEISFVKTDFLDYLGIISSPSEEFMKKATAVGERCTWESKSLLILSSILHFGSQRSGW